MAFKESSNISKRGGTTTSVSPLVRPEPTAEEKEKDRRRNEEETKQGERKKNNLRVVLDSF